MYHTRAKTKIDQMTYPKNCAPAGPISTSLLANPSPSTMGGGLASLCLFTKRQVMRGGRRALARRDDDSHPVVTAPSHGAASCIHHKANQEPAGRRPEMKSRMETCHLHRRF